MTLFKNPLKLKFSKLPFYYYLAAFAFLAMLTGTALLALGTAPLALLAMPAVLLSAGIITGSISVVAYCRDYARSGSSINSATSHEVINSAQRPRISDHSTIGSKSEITAAKFGRLGFFTPLPATKESSAIEMTNTKQENIKNSAASDRVF